MELAKGIMDSILAYQQLKLEEEKLCRAIKEEIEKQYLEQTGFTLGVSAVVPSIVSAPEGTLEDETGTYILERPIGENSPMKGRHWYSGREFIKIAGTDKFVRLDYER